ncbi:hypothetical protein FVEN_g8239 [Fusarium venenatum]|nr:hypothetical protein FVEN_g8239 [Fusarium venenatum]
MPTVKKPCLECKNKHLKCDQKSKCCRRCESRGLDCVRSEGRQFKQGSSAKYDALFSETQSWVSGNAKEFRLQTGPRRRIKKIAIGNDTTTSMPTIDTSGDQSQSNLSDYDDTRDTSTSAPQSSSYTNTEITKSLIPFGNSQFGSATRLASYPQPMRDNFALSQRGPSWGGLLHTIEPPQGRDSPLEGIQEACLLRYFIEDLSSWFDLVDSQRRYQLMVPERACRYPPLLNAIFAMSSRHLCRVERYKTPQGIVYRGQPLPNLTPGSSVEYMLKCISVLKDFHTTQDGEIRELIVTTAVILRHYEELDDHDQDTGSEMDFDEGVNFLAILNAVLRSLTADDLSHRRELLNASYWIALRQEVYYSLLKGYSPQIVEPPAEWVDISPANKLVSHTNQVAKWLFSDKSETGWRNLKKQEEYLDECVTGRFSPILYRPPDKISGEVFPMMWFASPIALTGMQHMMIAKMILIAESPFLSQEKDVRAAYREAEGKVRALVLEVCGTAVQHPEIQPGLVNATLAIQMYGSYFTDPWEREALRRTVRMFKDCQAWPLPRVLRTFLQAGN